MVTFAGVALEIAALLFALFLRHLSFKTLKKEEKRKLHILPFHYLSFCITKKETQYLQIAILILIPLLFMYHKTSFHISMTMRNL